MSLSSAESELYAAVKAASEGLKGLGCDVRAELAPGRFSNNVLGQSQRTGQRQTRRHAELVASKSGRFVTKKVGTNVNPADLISKPLPKPKIEQLMNHMGYEFTKTETNVLKCQPART